MNKDNSDAIRITKYRQENSCRGHFSERIKTAAEICLYLLFSALQACISISGMIGIELGSIQLQSTVVSGILAQGLVMLSVGIVLIPLKYNYGIVLILNISNIIHLIYSILAFSVTEAIPGLLISISTIIIVTIIHQYKRNQIRQFHEVTMQKEQLLQYNSIMKENEKSLNKLAFYDSLTELPNRKMMIDRLNHLTTPLYNNQKNFFFVFIDLDNFKQINDAMGHGVGDMVLRKVVERWRMLVKNDDMLARFGGDEFALLISRDMTSHELYHCILEYNEILTHAITINNKDLHVTISCGITQYPMDGKNTTELLKNADIALYEVKSNGKSGLLFYKPEMKDNVIYNIKLENGLLNAAKNNELYVVFQPLYFSKSNTLRGVEALARWNSPELGEVTPSQFIPIAEKTGSINEIGEWIMRTSLKKFKDLQNLYPLPLTISINISVIQIMDSNFISKVKKIIHETDFDCRHLEFEITESVFISYREHFINVLNELRTLGIQIALDDFGTGYASLSYLQLLPIDTLKIDKSFIEKITLETENKQIIGTMINLAHQLNMNVVAEGVEQELQLDYLLEKKCDYLQGYLFSKPLTEKELKQFFNDILLHSPYRYEAKQQISDLPSNNNTASRQVPPL